MVTIAPVVQHAGVHFAAVGLPGMLNAGGAVTACSLAPAGAVESQGLSDRQAASMYIQISNSVHGGTLAVFLLLYYHHAP